MDHGYTQFIQKLNTYRYQHAVVNCGQKLLHLIMKTLIIGDINNIIDCVRAALGSNTQYKNSFTKDEQKHLENGDHEKWDIPLLFKLIQKVCGLAPADNNCWTQENSGEESLEYLITRLKEMRNELVHKFGLVINGDELAEGLVQLTDLALKITSALVERAREHGKQSEKESEETMEFVLQIIEDVKQKINEGEGGGSAAVGSSNDNDEGSRLQFDSVYPTPGAVGQVPQEPSLEELLLEKEFWELAGSKNVVV